VIGVVVWVEPVVEEPLDDVGRLPDVVLLLLVDSIGVLVDVVVVNGWLAWLESVLGEPEGTEDWELVVIDWLVDFDVFDEASGLLSVIDGVSVVRRSSIFPVVDSEFSVEVDGLEDFGAVDGDSGRLLLDEGVSVVRT
ncbi:hypothetical protein CAEBREN_10510, partial [Caenorhabditis brenneri]